MKRLFAILVTLLLLLSGCEGGKQSGIQSDDIITVDVLAKYPKKELILQDFLDVEYIPLETNDEFVTAGYVQAIGKNIILVKNFNRGGDRGDIFVFDRDGKGLRKINRRGQGNEEYTNISGITLDEENGEMYVNSYLIKKVLVYDLFGDFKRNFRYIEGGDESGRFKSDIGYDPIYNFDKDNLICHDFTSGRNFNGAIYRDLEPRNIFWIVSKQDGSAVKEIQIPFEKKVFQGAAVNGRIRTVVDNPGLIPYYPNWILADPSSDTIYHYSVNNKMIPFIIRTPSVQSMDPEVFLFPGVITERYYFMQTVKKEYDQALAGGLPKIELVYDREEKKIFEYVVYNSDFADNRPIKNLVNEIPALTVVNNDEIAFAERIEAYELIEAYREGKLKGKLKEIAAGLYEESNPVIMLAKYKK